jgi:hypothetical protein
MQFRQPRILLSGAVALALASFLAGASLRGSWAQAPEKKAVPEQAHTEYPYLPDRFGEAYIPSVADWQALRLTALGASTTPLTDAFRRQHLTCFAGSKGLALTLDLLPEPGWKFYVGEGKFSAPPEKVKADLMKAISESVLLVRRFFPEVKDENLYTRVYIRSESVAVWEDGKLLLNSEKP